MSENINYTPPEEGFVAPFAADEESPYIFISYAHDDYKRVFPIITRLYEQGWKIWYDKGIPPATNYNEVIATHINDCALFLMFVTQTACERQYVIENEVEYAIRKKRKEQIMLCFLEDDIVMPPAADMQLGSVEKPKYRKVEESELESVLSGIEGLTKGEPRKATGFNVGGNERVIMDDGGEFEFRKCVGGVRLTRYLGSDTDVFIPSEYPAGSRQRVVGLWDIFSWDFTVHSIHIPSCVTDVGYMYLGKSCTIHCAENSAAHEYAKKENLPYVIDNSLAVCEELESSASQSSYAYISYSSNVQQRADEIISALEKHNCTVLDGNSLSGSEAMKAIRECACFVALVSQSYMQGDDIESLRTASAMNKQKLIYVLEPCDLPRDLSIVNESQQQLRYDALNEDQRTTELVNWLQKNGCRRVSVDIPDFEYTATASDGITLTKYTGNGGEVVIPSKHGGLSVRSIGDGVFFRKNLTAITIPDGVTSIGDRAFSSCSNLTAITIPDSVTIIGNKTFSDCISLTAITIPDGVTSIGGSAFSGCSSLTAITIPDSVTSIGSSAFSDCISLTAITVPDSVTSIGKRAFLGCISLTAITIPDSVTSIGKRAFSDCRSLTAITIPDSVTSIDYGAFSDCRSLTAICVNYSNESYCDIDGVLFSKDESIIVAYPNAHSNEYIIPDSVASIGSSAFSGCSSLTGITIPDSVTSIDQGAFSGCPNLTVYCPENSYVWQYCEENGIKHEPLSAAVSEHPAEQAETPIPAVDTPATPAESSAETAPSTTPRKKSPARWLVPALVLLALAAAAGLQLSGLVDILGLLGL